MNSSKFNIISDRWIYGNKSELHKEEQYRKVGARLHDKIDKEGKEKAMTYIGLCLNAQKPRQRGEECQAMGGLNLKNIQRIRQHIWNFPHPNSLLMAFTYMNLNVKSYCKLKLASVRCYIHSKYCIILEALNNGREFYIHLFLLCV